MRFHLASALSGLGVAGLVLLLTSQGTVIHQVGVRVDYLPHPRDLVQISGPAPYTVPTGKIFVLTALGSGNGQTGPVALSVDGQSAVKGNGYGSTGDVNSMHVIPLGLSVAAGSAISLVFEGSGYDPAQLRAWGYLADQ